ncbi:hypothetical protein QE109_16440 [Fusibacter bizertensis]|uniref:GyrI-like small molecule binding domain-containing protein n=1 Tax=Fusibacter bizertensis TaxID=1488331 RepID=A0ABT6NH51_9FIRM|nr:GyrI-like domain-containing protein [Fusibacter bizertensis]MDH8679749.1 hypothetical protein [Fusibacter bizertensis]
MKWGWTEHVQALWKAIFSEWFPSSDYEATTGARTEMYYKTKGANEFKLSSSIILYNFSAS